MPKREPLRTARTGPGDDATERRPLAGELGEAGRLATGRLVGVDPTGVIGLDHGLLSRRGEAGHERGVEERKAVLQPAGTLAARFRC